MSDATQSAISAIALTLIVTGFMWCFVGIVVWLDEKKDKKKEEKDG